MAQQSGLNSFCTQETPGEPLDMSVQYTTASTSLQELSGASIVLGFVRNAPVVESQESSDTSGQGVPNSSPTWINYRQDIPTIVRYAEALKSIEPFLDKFYQCAAEHLTAMDFAWSTEWQNMEHAPQNQLASRQDHIVDASSHGGILRLLRLFGLESIADRLAYLQGLALDDPDEQPMEIDSLRELAIFLMEERQLSNPELTISPTGLAQAEWRVGKSGLLAMEFQPTGLIRFAAISAPATHGKQRTIVSGTMQKAATLEAIQVFKTQLM